MKQAHNKELTFVLFISIRVCLYRVSWFSKLTRDRERSFTFNLNWIKRNTFLQKLYLLKSNRVKSAEIDLWTIEIPTDPLSSLLFFSKLNLNSTKSNWSLSTSNKRVVEDRLTMGVEVDRESRELPSRFQLK